MAWNCKRTHDQCEHSDAWKCAVSRRLTDQIACHCPCHRYIQDQIKELDEAKELRVGRRSVMIREAEAYVRDKMETNPKLTTSDMVCDFALDVLELKQQLIDRERRKLEDNDGFNAAGFEGMPEEVHVADPNQLNDAKLIIEELIKSPSLLPDLELAALKTILARQEVLETALGEVNEFVGQKLGRIL